MDYSLLIAIEKRKKGVELKSSFSEMFKRESLNISTSDDTGMKKSKDCVNGQRLSRYQYLSTCGEQIYHVAVIDYL